VSAPDFTKPRPDFAKFVPPGCDIRSRDIEQLTDRVKSVRVVVNAIVEGQQAKAELKRMEADKQAAIRADVERVKAKMLAAANVVPQVTKHLEEHADRIVSRGDDVMNRSDKVCAPHVAMLDESDHGLDDLESVLQVMGNGGPLPSSGSSER